MLQVTQLMQHRLGRPVHWCAIEIACSHGRLDGEVHVRPDHELPALVGVQVSVQAIHRLLHQLIDEHGQQTHCRCAAALRVCCWPAQAAPIAIVSGFERFSRN